MSKLRSGAEGGGEANGEPLSKSAASHPAITCRDFSVQCDERRFGDAGEHQHDSTEIGFLFGQGVGILTCADHLGRECEHRLVAPVVYLVPARVKHSTRWVVRSEIFCAHIDPHFWRRAVFTGHTPPTVHGVVRGAATDLVLWEFASLLRHVWDERDGTDDEPALCLADSMLIRVSKLIFGEQVEHGANGTTLSHGRLMAMDDFIDRRLRYHLHTPDLAKQAGLSVPHLTTVLKHSTGLTPHAYISRRRMLKAHQLLASGDYRLREVATEVGFDDPDHFSRKFRQYFNYPPRSLMLRGRGQAENSPGKP